MLLIQTPPAFLVAQPELVFLVDANAAAMVICKPRCPISRATTHKDILKSPARMRTLCSAIVEASSSQNCVWDDAKPLAFVAVR